MQTAEIFLLLLSGAALVSAQAIPGTLDWCSYWRARNIPKQECQGVPTIPPTMPPTFLPMCSVPVLTSCTPNFNCASGSSCVQNNQLCCAPMVMNDAVCPSVQDLGITCNKTKPTNWCNTNDQCHTAPRRLCCPTGCNYNICVQGGNPVARDPTSTVDPLCPAPELVEITCQVTKPTNWCLSQDVCLDRNSAQQRRCCQTRCNYNVCMLNYNGKWIIA
uniref:WAP domain-containing protein n=1 Tax=Plectus sambesii TaxID=2011161 RepID=A0A914XCB9_9BILA